MIIGQLMCLQCLFYLALLLVSSGNSFASEQLNIPLNSGDELKVERFPATGKYLMLWFAPEYGFRPAHRALADGLRQQHVEVWQSNIPDSLFLPNGTRTIKQLDGQHVAELITYAHNISHKKIVVAGDSYAAVIALRGAHRWQEGQPGSSYLLGAVLFTPYTFTTIPKLGQLPEYLPIVSATNIPLMIYQAQNSPTIGQFDSLLGQLQQHGNPVYIRYLPNIMSLFYQQSPTLAMQQQAKPLPKHIRKILGYLEQQPAPGRPIALTMTTASDNGIDIQLKTFQGNETPGAIALRNTSGKTITRKDYKGKVTIINFWATWCPPCIEEIPSLNRLKNKMHGLPFELISINYAEDKDTIQQFMQRVHVDFPVLLDNKGEFAKQWKVISYPSTFIIDASGKIRYGVNAAIEWDRPEIIGKLKSLM